MFNYDNIVLIGSNVLVRLDNSDESKVYSGTVLSNGIVLAIGPEAKNAKVGGRVFFYESAGRLFNKDSSEPRILLMSSQEFQAVEKNPSLDK